MTEYIPNSTYASILKGFQVKHRNISISEDTGRIPPNKFTIMFRIYYKETKTQGQCKACKSSYHKTHLNGDCPFNQNNIFYIFSELGIKPNAANLNMYIRDFSRNVELPIYAYTGEVIHTYKKYHWEMNLDDYNKEHKKNRSSAWLDFIGLHKKLSKVTDEVSKLRNEVSKLRNEKKYLIKNNLVKDTVECSLCLENVSVDNLYKDQCDCKYMYCKACYDRLPKVYDNNHKLVRKCPSCRSVAL